MSVVGYERRCFTDDGVEAKVLVRCVVHGTHGAIRFYQAVLALHHVAVAVLGMVLYVACVEVVHAVLVRVLGVRLQQATITIRR